LQQNCYLLALIEAQIHQFSAEQRRCGMDSQFSAAAAWADGRAPRSRRMAAARTAEQQRPRVGWAAARAGEERPR